MLSYFFLEYRVFYLPEIRLHFLPQVCSTLQDTQKIKQQLAEDISLLPTCLDQNIVKLYDFEQLTALSKAHKTAVLSAGDPSCYLYQNLFFYIDIYFAVLFT